MDASHPDLHEVARRMGSPGDQRPITFGGVKLPPVEWHGATCTAPGALLTGPEYVDSREVLRLATAASPPAGTDSPGKRLLDVSRLALSARILHGTKLSELRDAFELLTEIEEGFLSE